MTEEKIDLLVDGGKAAPDADTGPKLSAYALNMGELFKAINDKTKEYAGIKVPIKIIINKETKEYRIEIGVPPVSSLIKKELGIEKAAPPKDDTKTAETKETAAPATEEETEKIAEGGTEPEKPEETSPVPKEEEKPKEDFFEEQQVPTNEAEEGEDDLDLDLDLGDEEGKDISGELDTPEEAPVKEPKAEEEPVEIPELPDSGTEEPTEAPVEEPVSSEPAPDLTAPQTYLVVYDISGDEREEIFRCGSNNVVNAFKEFYNDTFKGSMKAAILNYKEQKEQEKVKAEKSEKEKAQSDKQSKLKKFLGENLNEESFDEQEFLDNEDEDEDMELENDEYLEDEELDNEEVEDLEDDEFAGDDDELNYDDDELNDEEYDDDDLADYEWEVGKYITDTLAADDIEYDEDNFGEIMRDRIETVLDCMKSEVSAEECGQQLMNDEDFMAELTNVE